MITEWFIWLGSQISNLFAGMFPDFTTPAWFSDFGGVLGKITDGAAGIGNLVGWSYIVPMFLVAISVYTGALIVKAAMKVWSFVPFVGGTG